MLREEKDKLEKELQETQAKVNCGLCVRVCVCVRVRACAC